MDNVWRSLLDGKTRTGSALLLAAGALVAALIVTAFVLRPLVLALSRRDPEKVRDSRMRRIGFALLVTCLASAAFVFFYATRLPADRPAHLGYALAKFVLILFGGFTLFELILTLFADFVPQVRGRAPVSPIFKDLLRTVVVLGFFLVAVKLAYPTADIGAILTTSAILSIVLGLALQESLSNIFAGIMLSVDRPYKPNEWVEVEGKEGRILDSNWRSTRLLTRDNDVVYIPNSSMAKSTLVNFSSPTSVHLCRRRLGVEYGAPPNKVRAVLTTMMAHVDGVLKKPAPDVFVADYGDSAIVYELRFWIDDPARRPRIESDVMRDVWYHLKRNGIGIPFPVRDVYLRRAQPEQKPEELVRLLAEVDILKPLADPERQLLARDLTSQLFARGEVVCRQGEPGSTFYIIRSGLISVLARADGGVETEVAQLKPGSYLGEMSLLTGEPRASTCKALEDSELLCLDRESFSVLLGENPAVAQAMSEVLARRTVATQEKLAKERGAVESPPQVDEARTKILEKIWRIFRFRG